MRRTPLLLAMLSLSTLWPAQVGAHPLAPGLLELAQRPEGRFDVTWKTPRTQAPGTRLAPILPKRCAPLTPRVEEALATGIVRRWTVDCGAAPLVGETISVSGLDASASGVLLRVEFVGGRAVRRMLDRDAPGFVLPRAADRWGVFESFAGLGVAHLVSGLDHVLFVLVLTVLVGWGRRLLWTLTLFTLAHSLTLSLAVLGAVHFPSRLVEALIALSVVLASVELVRAGRLSRGPWAMAGAFGLLHGMGFAGALAATGLPAAEIPLALAAFNLGIEIGQLGVVGAALALGAIVRHLGLREPLTLRPAAGYVLGTLAAVWFWQRVALVALG